MTVEQLTNEALALPSHDRAELASQLVASLETNEDDRIHRLWVAEVKKRIADVRTGKSQLLDSNEVFMESRQAVAR